MNTRVKRYHFWFVWMAAIGLYFYHPLVTGKVLGDGGLFYVMTRALLHSWPREPLYIVYNGQTFPFAYPPLGFYLVACLQKLTKVSLLSLFQWVPATLTFLHAITFFLLSKEIFHRTDFAVGSTLFFITNFPSYTWMIYGGGITRSLAYLLALMAVLFIARWAKSDSYRDLVMTGVLFGATLLSHSGTAFAVFIALEISFILICVKRKRTVQCIGQNVVFLAIALLVASPWWGVVIKRYGITPLVYAFSTGHKSWYSIFLLQVPFWPHAPLFLGILPFFVIAGVCADPPIRLRLLLTGGILLAFIVTPRAPFRYGAPLIAWLAQLGIEKLNSNFSPKARALVTGWVALSLFSIASLITLKMSGISRADIDLLRSLTRLTQHSSHGMMALPMPKGWGSDFYNEWAPAFVDFQVPLVVQGHEWTGEFFEKVRRRDNAIILLESGLQGICTVLYQYRVDLVWIHPSQDHTLQPIFEAMEFKLILHHPLGGTIYQVDLTKCKDVALGATRQSLFPELRSTNTPTLYGEMQLGGSKVNKGQKGVCAVALAPGGRVGFWLNELFSTVGTELQTGLRGPDGATFRGCCLLCLCWPNSRTPSPQRCESA